MDNMRIHVHIEGAEALTRLQTLYNLTASYPHRCAQVKSFIYRPDQDSLAHESSRLGFRSLLETLIAKLVNVREIEVPFDRLAGPPQDHQVDSPVYQNAFCNLTRLRTITFTNGDLSPGNSSAAKNDRNLVWLMVPNLKILELVDADLQPVFSHLQRSKCRCLMMKMPPSWNPRRARTVAWAFKRLNQLNIDIPRYSTSQALRSNWEHTIHHDFRILVDLQTLEISLRGPIHADKATETKHFGDLVRLRRLSVPVSLVELQNPSAQRNAGDIIRHLFPPTLVYLKLFISHASEFQHLAKLMQLLVDAKNITEDYLSNLLEVRIECDDESGLKEWFMDDNAEFRAKLKDLGAEGVDDLWTAIRKLRDLNEDEPIEVVTDFGPGFLSEDEEQEDI